jgi:NTP pyrophosphatase (non-canonical NTP hydrolase)
MGCVPTPGAFSHGIILKLMDIQELTRAMHEFVTAKGWYLPDSIHPQTPRNLAISLSLEANEVLEHFQWQEKAADADQLAAELADVTLYLIQLAHISGIDLEEAVLSKLQANYKRHWNAPGAPNGNPQET